MIVMMEMGAMTSEATASERDQTLRRRLMTLLRVGWPVLAILGVLWFPFDWLAEVWPAFGVPFRHVFRDAHDHFVGHTIFFLIVGTLILAYIPALRRRPHWYFPCLALAALVQETIQALFRGQAPTFTDLNAFAGDALGGAGAFALWLALMGTAALVGRVRSGRDTKRER
jgi:hypothetical protein